MHRYMHGYMYRYMHRYGYGAFSRGGKCEKLGHTGLYGVKIANRLEDSSWNCGVTH